MTFDALIGLMSITAELEQISVRIITILFDLGWKRIEVNSKAAIYRGVYKR